MSSRERKSCLSVSTDGPTFFFNDVGLMKKLNCAVVLTNSHLFQTSNLISLNVKLLKLETWIWYHNVPSFLITILQQFCFWNSGGKVRTVFWTSLKILIFEWCYWKIREISKRGGWNMRVGEDSGSDPSVYYG